MKKFVFTIKEDVCTANGKDEAKQNELLSVMTHYGSVEDYDKVVGIVKAEYQSLIDNLTNQINAIKDQDLTAHEINMVKAFRNEVGQIEVSHKAENARLTVELQRFKAETEQRYEKLKAILGE